MKWARWFVHNAAIVCHHRLILCHSLLWLSVVCVCVEFLTFKKSLLCQNYYDFTAPFISSVWLVIVVDILVQILPLYSNFVFYFQFQCHSATASVFLKFLSLPLIAKSAIRLNEITYALLASYCPALLWLGFVSQSKGKGAMIHTLLRLICCRRELLLSLKPL